MLTPNRRSYALGCSPSVKLDRPSHLDEILPQKSKEKRYLQSHQPEQLFKVMSQALTLMLTTPKLILLKTTKQSKPSLFFLKTFFLQHCVAVFDCSCSLCQSFSPFSLKVSQNSHQGKKAEFCFKFTKYTLPSLCFR